MSSGRDRVPGTADAGVDTVKDAIRKALTENFSIPSSSIEDHTSVANLGINSIAVLELARVISARFGVDVRSSTIYEDPSIEALAKRVHGMVTGAGQAGGQGDLPSAAHRHTGDLRHA
jgi:acyl carrier protein